MKLSAEMGKGGKMEVNARWAKDFTKKEINKNRLLHAKTTRPINVLFFYAFRERENDIFDKCPT